MEELTSDDPRAVGPYRLTARLGEGGMGRVYLGQSRSGRRVAVKVVRAEIAGDPAFRTRFRREVEAARAIGGFWTAPVVDADPEATIPWVASDYLPAPSLSELVAERGPMSESDVRALAAGLAEALEAIHRMGLVHRDLKPSNILVTADGPRVIDFGISKAMEGATALTSTGMVIGTPGFMSPEQASGAPVGPPSDIFSLGAVLVFAATKEGPFGEGSVPAQLYRVVHDVPQLDGVPPLLRPVLARCLEKDPERRPSAEGLQDLLHGDGPATRTATAQAPTPAPAQAPAPTTHPRHPMRTPLAASSTTTPPGPRRTAPGPARAGRRDGAVEVRGPVPVNSGANRVFAVAVLTVVMGTFSDGAPTLGGFLISAAVAGLFCLFGVFLLRRAKEPADSVVAVSPQGLAFRFNTYEWNVSWDRLESVSLYTQQPASSRAWIVEAVLWDGARKAVPAAFRSKNQEKAAAATLLVFTSKQAALTELARLDTALRRHAPQLYERHQSLAALLRT
ncbi:serine/threonine protein kinase [Streptomyces sp. NBC_01795]|uniref:serine/threonine-protein kinase n=1 Tax=Streptomyces sp. NBC_01795 TaxID=2975943 RepID=UPI002DDB5FE9|nr:serine/threonine-protein kinase [Streptomyces sp. NBC_01795]WSA94935.1 serine/threonine protein kinase [Streptomyces sp. NBC_01795]